MIALFKTSQNQESTSETGTSKVWWMLNVSSYHFSMNTFQIGALIYYVTADMLLVNWQAANSISKGGGMWKGMLTTTVSWLAVIPKGWMRTWLKNEIPKEKKKPKIRELQSQPQTDVSVCTDNTLFFKTLTQKEKRHLLCTRLGSYRSQTRMKAVHPKLVLFEASKPFIEPCTPKAHYKLRDKTSQEKRSTVPISWLEGGSFWQATF